MARFENAEGDHEQSLQKLMRRFNLEDEVELKAFLYEFEDLLLDSRHSEGMLIHKAVILNNYLWGELDDDDDFTHLQAACRLGFDDVVEKMLSYWENPNIRVRHTGDSPLILAMKNEHQAVVEVLLKNRADPNLANNDGMTPLHIMCQQEEFNEDLANLFFQCIDDRRHLLAINAQDNNGNNALHLAISRGHRKAVVLLLGRGADANSTNEDGETPLHLMCRGHGDLEMMDTFFRITDEECLLGGMDAKRDNQLNTPLHLALLLPHSKDNRMMVRELLSRGADPDLTNAQGDAALHIVCKRPGDETELLETLLSITLWRRPLVDARNAEGRTPLELAAAALCPNKVRVLLEKGADASTFVFRYQDFAKAADFNLDMMCCILFEQLESKGFTMQPDQVEPLVVEIAKRLKICRGVSLYDAALDSEAAREFSYQVFYEFVSTYDLWLRPSRPVKSSHRRLCHMLKRGLNRLFVKKVVNNKWIKE